jgi:hypothetical protein
MAKRSKKVSTKHVGKAIQLAIKQLRAVRPSATAKGKKHVDLNIKALQLSSERIKAACKGNWTSPQP